MVVLPKLGHVLAFVMILGNNYDVSLNFNSVRRNERYRTGMLCKQSEHGQSKGPSAYHLKHDSCSRYIGIHLPYLEVYDIEQPTEASL